MFDRDLGDPRVALGTGTPIGSHAGTVHRPLAPSCYFVGPWLLEEMARASMLVDSASYSPPTNTGQPLAVARGPVFLICPIRSCLLSYHLGTKSLVFIPTERLSLPPSLSSSRLRPNQLLFLCRRATSFFFFLLDIRYFTTYNNRGSSHSLPILERVTTKNPSTPRPLVCNIDIAEITSPAP